MVSEKLQKMVDEIRSEDGDKAAEEFLSQVIPSIENGEYFQGFDQDNCEDCKGWDGFDRRCQCGARRVYWSYMGPTGTEGGVWYPQAD